MPGLFCMETVSETAPPVQAAAEETQKVGFSAEGPALPARAAVGSRPARIASASASARNLILFFIIYCPSHMDGYCG